MSRYRTRDGAELLFQQGELRDFLNQRLAKAKADIDALSPDALTNSTVDELVKRVVERNTLISPTLRRGLDNVEMEQEEVKVRAGEFGDSFMFANPHALVDATCYRFFVPLEGDEVLLRFQPSTRNFNPPRAEVEAGSLVFTQVKRNVNAAEVQSGLDHSLNEIEQWLRWVGVDVLAWNDELPRACRARIEERRQRVIASTGVTSQLGFKLRRRDNAPQTYAPQEVRRAVRPQVASEHGSGDKARATKPEPALRMDDFDFVLSKLSDMALVLERSPKAFSQMGEEHLRFLFLVPLNSHFESVSGETFNFEGKTDILIRSEGKNIFIAECKIWHGAKHFTETIDQILGYVSWRDTKAAILVFSRNKDFTSVIGQIPKLVQGHPNFVREEKAHRETEFRAVLRHRDDPARHLTLAVLAFQIA